MMLIQSANNSNPTMISEHSSLLPQHNHVNGNYPKTLEEEECFEEGRWIKGWLRSKNFHHSSGTCLKVAWVLLGTVLGMLLMQVIHLAVPLINNSHIIHNNNPTQNNNNMLDTVPSRYTHFQPFGYQIYTGGAPAYLNSKEADLEDVISGKIQLNPECEGLNSLGHSDDGDDECYLGLNNGTADVSLRLQILTDAVEKAYQLADRSPKTLKIFVAPEFFFRGYNGAYIYPASHEVNFEEDCLEICQILRGLENLVAQARFQDWLFLFGTIVVAEVLPQEDQYDYLFYNFAPIFKGYDPTVSNSVGKRFLLPKRYVSNIDFLTPRRSFNDSVAKELLQQKYGPPSETTVASPYDMYHEKYDREMWYKYKSEIDASGYTMIEYDWLILDGITFSIEVCLDHDLKTALNSYLGDAAQGSPIRIPNFHDNSVEWVPIPKHLAQISLVSSSGMTANPESMALCHGGTIFLQDGQSGVDSSLKWSLQEDDVCQRLSWHFNGGSEAFSRFANITNTEARFYYKANPNYSKVPIYDENFNDDSAQEKWKDAIQGVFTATKYPPAITVYTPFPIAQV